jgi:FAR-17a/AIG1-like protein
LLYVWADVRQHVPKIPAQNSRQSLSRRSLCTACQLPPKLGSLTKTKGDSMISENSGGARTYRWIVFLLMLGFWFYQFTQTSLDAFGWQFRFLTIWGLTFYLIVSALMLRRSLGKSSRDHNPLVSATVVLGAVVVFMYWRLWFIDPALVNSGGPLVWYQEYYLHALGPALLAFDAFLILGVFRRILATLVTMLAIFVSYILWIEKLVRPLNSFPEGEADAGLPYPFLNDMDFDARLVFYASTIGTALVFMAVGWGIAAGLRRLGQQAVNPG